MGKVIYLTGAPASGKSSTARLLAANNPNLLIWEYGAKLTQHLKNRLSEAPNHAQLRLQSSSIVTSMDIDAVDRALVTFVADNREDNNVIIDSHAVTKEVFGFRITPFSLKQFGELAPDEIWVLYASPSVTIKRIANDPDGRALVDEEGAHLHSTLQASVAATYGMSLGRPVYFFDTTSGDREGLLSRLERRLQ